MIYVTSITVTPRKQELNVGDKYDLKAEVCPSNATCKSVHWRSLDPDIAYVSATSGRVHARMEGTTYIYADAVDGSGVYGYMRIKVCNPSVEGVPVMVKCVDGLTLMSKASGGSELGTVNNGSIIYLINSTPQNENMFYVFGTMSDGREMFGWCSGEYLEKETTFLKYVTETGTSNVRTNYSINDNNIVGEISCGMQVELVQEKVATKDGYDWHKIIYNDQIAYIANFSGRFEKVVRLAPLRYNKSAIVADRYLTTEEKQHNAKIIYNYLTYKGWSKNAICGAIANMEAESTLSPGIWERQKETDHSEPGYGLLQWDPFTKWTNYAQTHNYEQENIYRQLDYFIYSTRYGGGEWVVNNIPSEYQLYIQEYVYSTRNVFDLAITFLLCYERPTDTDSSVMNYRGSLAETWKKYFDSIGW